jgi:hypothetical protein
LSLLVQRISTTLDFLFDILIVLFTISMFTFDDYFEFLWRWLVYIYQYIYEH